MIHAHMATFPARAGVLMQAVRSILPQVDRLCICLNQHETIPGALAGEPKIEAFIPDRDLKDAGKFAFAVPPDDWVFTIDDDILYPPDYVSATLAHFDQLDPQRDVVGHLGHAWMAKGKERRLGWKNWMFQKRAPHLLKVDVLGTGTSCQLGANLPKLDQIKDAAGFVDLRHARLHAGAGRFLWLLPHAADWMTSLMTDDLRESSLFQTVNLQRHPGMIRETVSLMRDRTPYSGEHHSRLLARGLLARDG